MKAKPIKVKEQKSNSGGIFYWIFFKGENGSSFRTCVSPICGNFKRWEPVINKVRSGVEIWLDDLNIRGYRLIDADSRFKVISC